MDGCYCTGVEHSEHIECMESNDLKEDLSLESTGEMILFEDIGLIFEERICPPTPPAKKDGANSKNLVPITRDIICKMTYPNKNDWCKPSIRRRDAAAKNKLIQPGCASLGARPPWE